MYFPVLKTQARKCLGLPENKLFILFAAMRIDAIKKGYCYFKNALEIFKKRNQQMAREVEILVFGSGNIEIMKNLPFPIHMLGHLCEEKQIALAYNAASVFVIPSLEENLPNTIMESFACGTPVVGFNIGGIPEMIEHQHNGYLADYASAESLAERMEWVLQNNADGVLSRNARRKVLDCYSEKKVAAQYGKLYDRLLQR